MEDLIAPCKWRACQETFRSQDELVEHVLAEHVEKAIPIKRKVFSYSQNVEEGDSMDSNNSMINPRNQSLEYPISNEDPDLQEAMTKTSPQVDELDDPPSTPPSSRVPTFRPLSEAASPRDTPHIHSIGASPTTSALVAEVAGGASQRGRISTPRTPSRSIMRMSATPQVQRPTPSPTTSGSTAGSRSGTASQESASYLHEIFAQPTTTLPPVVEPASPSPAETGIVSVTQPETQDPNSNLSGFRSGAFHSGGHQIMLSSPPLSALRQENLLDPSQTSTYPGSDMLNGEAVGFTQLDLGSLAPHGGHEDSDGAPWALQTQASYTFPTQSELDPQLDMDVVMESHSRTQMHTQGA